jgi:hypothetical protein
MKMLPKDYAKAVGTPFRTESYDGAVLEMYYLNDRDDFHKFAARGRFSVWTSDGVNYRLFVEKGYYEAVSDLYLNEVNTIWLDFTNSIYAAQRRMSRIYMGVSMIVLLVVLVASMILQTFMPEQANNVFLAAMVVLFIGLFVSSNGQQKKLRALVGEENKKATQLIKDTLGEEKFQNILNGQEKYYETYFKTEEEPVQDTESADPETLEIETESSDSEDTTNKE